MASSSPRPLLLAAALAAACSAERSLPPPAPSGLDPSVGYAVVDVPVLIHGDAFYVRGSFAVDGSEDDRVSAEFRAWLGDAPLAEVTWIDTGTLSAVVPAGSLAVGSHDLVVEGPYGTRGTAPAAYLAVAGTPPMLTVEPVAVPTTVLVGEPAEIRVTVTNHGPGPIEDVQLQLKRVENGVAKVPVLVPGARDLLENESFQAVYAVSTSVAGTFEFEAKADGTTPPDGAFVAASKVRVTLEVVEPPP